MAFTVAVLSPLHMKLHTLADIFEKSLTDLGRLNTLWPDNVNIKPVQSKCETDPTQNFK